MVREGISAGPLMSFELHSTAVIVSKLGLIETMKLFYVKLMISCLLKNYLKTRMNTHFLPNYLNFDCKYQDHKVSILIKKSQGTQY